MKHKIIIFGILTFLFSACDFQIWEIKEPSTKKKSEVLIKKKGKVAKAINFLNEVFGEEDISFEKSNIEKIYEFSDKEKRNCLKLVSFKKNGYALISNIKNIENPPVLMYSKEEFDPKNPNPGLVAYMQEFSEKAARDPENAILPGSKNKKDEKNSNNSKKNLTRSYGGYYNNGCYDKWGNRRNCESDCLHPTSNINQICRNLYAYYTYPKQCGGGICYDNYGNLKDYGYYRKQTLIKTWSRTITQAPLLETYWKQISPYNK